MLSGAPFGYRNIRKDEGGGAARCENVLNKARVVRQVFSWVALERASIGEVCRRLNAADERTRTVHVRERSVVWAMLKNRAYPGPSGIRQDPGRHTRTALACATRSRIATASAGGHSRCTFGTLADCPGPCAG